MHEKNTRTEKGLLADLAIAHQNSRPAMMIFISRDVSISSISIKDFVREKKIRNRKKERAAKTIFF
jgi:hypothetical protein